MTLVFPRENLNAGLLAAAVHGFFVLLLVFGVSWQIHEPQPIMAELWQALPEPVPALSKSTPIPTPKPVPEPAPEPALKPADIALEKKQKAEALKKQKIEEARALALKKEEQQKQALEQKELALLKQRQQAGDKRRRDELRRAELEQEQEAAQMEEDQRKREQAKKLADIKRREALRQEEEAMQRQAMEESLASEMNAAKAKSAAAQHASEVQKIVDRYKNMISDRVRSRTRLLDGLVGNPEAEFAVSVLPTGEITKVELLKSSGNAAYDREVLLGIQKSTPLPIPVDRDAASQFRYFVLKHKAKE